MESCQKHNHVHGKGCSMPQKICCEGQHRIIIMFDKQMHTEVVAITLGKSFQSRFSLGPAYCLLRDSGAQTHCSDGDFISSAAWRSARHYERATADASGYHLSSRPHVAAPTTRSRVPTGSRANRKLSTTAR